MKKLYSVKMRSSKEGLHISGAERIVLEEELKTVAIQLIERALNHSRGKADFVNLKIEELKKNPVYSPLLPVFEVTDYKSVKELLKKLFSLSKVPLELGIEVYKKLLTGPAPNGQIMRGAMIVAVPSGKRLEPNQYRGVRASYLDVDKETVSILKEKLEDRYTENFKEALVLSTKILHFNNVLGELCVSDDPDYTIGYLSLKGKGYFRIKNIKPQGLPKGGRAIFVEEKIDVEKFINYLEKEPFIAKGFLSYSVISVEELSSLFS
ncbi:6-carboxyhexanoate--CoA ligase [Desulfurobacterium thermolithotrophum DSM 11699]|uniref:6-carboxyhexanoate--CoA ligase n=1 Tax=Desulfurobacterium thermolithotrophum (strain DSM 11699 / BSA) TaxID=868864 RepID=F0S3F4_DESTD|nr:6-carboxyhexanoate--CoA ligase [Desulfurobacterium thermolithotrophum]ADY73376.1 6-carboxyhexanoate--CoA ligase [Desulfurobacterium thermolithotrophum DSM 11699]